MQQTLTVVIGLVMLSSVLRLGPDKRWRTTDTSLRGLGGVYVVVQYAAPINTQYGLSAENLRSVVELRLKANDMCVLSEEEWLESPGRPYLSLRIKGTKLSSDVKDPEYLFSWGLDLIQRVQTRRAPLTDCPAITWTEEYSAVLPEHELRTITVKVSDLALEFSDALRGAKSGGLHER